MFPLKTTLEFAHQPYLLNNKFFYVASRGKVRPLFQGLGVLDEAWQRGNTLNWQLWCADFDRESLTLSNETHIKTGFYVVCSPVAYYDEAGTIRISFIGGKVKDAMHYGLYSGRLDLTENRIVDIIPVDSPTHAFRRADRVSPWETPRANSAALLYRVAFCGFTLPQYSTQAPRRNRGQLTAIVNNREINLTTQLSVIYRVVPTPDDPYRMLVTGIKDDQEVTYVYQFFPDLGYLRHLGELIVNGKSVYKSIISKNLCIYAVKGDTNEFEHRHLYAAREFGLVAPVGEN